MQEINRACAAVSRTAGWASSCLHLKGGAANEDIKSKKISGKRTHDDASLDECPDSHSETEGDEGTDTDTYTDTDSSSFSETQDVTNEDAHAARGEESEESASRGDEDRSDSESTESDTSAGDEPLKDESSAGLQQCPAGQRCYSGAGCAFKLLKEVKLQQEPWAVAVGPKDKLLYVSLALKHKILVIDPESGAVLRAFHSRGIPTYEPGELRQEQDRMHATQGLSLGSGANLTQDGQHEKHGGRAPVEWDERKEALLHSPPAIDFELRKAHGGRRDGKQDKGLPYKLWVPCGIAFNPQGDLLVADRCVCVCVCVCVYFVCLSGSCHGVYSIRIRHTRVPLVGPRFPLRSALLLLQRKFVRAPHVPPRDPPRKDPQARPARTRGDGGRHQDGDGFRFGFDERLQRRVGPREEESKIGARSWCATRGEACECGGGDEGGGCGAVSGADGCACVCRRCCAVRGSKGTLRTCVSA
jgi:hypothetical protein